MAVSKLGLDIFIINNNFSTTKWKNYPLFLLSCSASSLTLNNWFVSRDVTDKLTYSPKIYMHSSNGFTVSTCIQMSFIYIFTPNKLWLFPLKTYISPKCFFTSLVISYITSGFLCDKLLSYTYQEMVHCVPSITLFAKNLSEGFISKPKPSSVVDNILYQKNIDSTQP